MQSGKVYLKENVLVEPLINQWYAWSYLIPPATAAMYISNQHIKIMQSFISAPQLHVAALKNPAMIGGPFINYDESRLNEIKALLAKTLKEQADALEFAGAIKELDETLSSLADGNSLEPLYKKVPDVLRGYVELVYDLNNHPSVRFIEGLLYKSRYYNPASQSVTLSFIEKDGRNFVFSTPRLQSDDSLHLHIPFKEQVLDELFRMKQVPQPLEHIKDSLKIAKEDEEFFSSLFTSEVPDMPVS
jgi:hypothetical protein